MDQQKPDRKIDEILKLVDELSAEEHDQLVEQMKLKWLRKAIDDADECVARGEVLSLEEMNQRLDKVHNEIVERQKK